MLADNTRLPLFPLDVVLFPGMMLPLHIFEERYKIMIKTCISNSEPFGVVLAKAKHAQPTSLPATPLDGMYEVGTTAQITAVEHLQDGRMNLIAVGQDRFQIRHIERDADDFFVGRVDPFPVQGSHNPARANGLAKKLRPMIKQYIDHLAEASGEDLSEATLPTDPTALAFLAATAMQGPLHDKQKLLATASLTPLVARAMQAIEREDKILVYMLKAYAAHQQVQKLPFVDYSLN